MAIKSSPGMILVQTTTIFPLPSTNINPRVATIHINGTHTKTCLLSSDCKLV